jgi:uncharacterized membrane protein (UPF0127 family)
MSLQPVQAHNRATFPVFGGICGDTSTKFKGLSLAFKVGIESTRVNRFYVRNTTRNTLLADEATVAKTFGQRLKGLMGVADFPVGRGLLIVPCTSIHTFFMKVAIDAIFLSADERVLEVYHALAPFRMSRLHPSARSVLELPAGMALSSRTEVGDRLVFESRNELVGS